MPMSRPLTLQGLDADQVLERCTIEKLHGNEGFTLMHPDLVDGANVGMVQGGSRARLAAETLQRLRIFSQVFRQELKGDEAAKLRVLGLVYHTHSATAQLLYDAV